MSVSADRGIEDNSLDYSHYLGRVIADRYRLTDIIGHGGMGVVYRAEHVTTGRMVAVKMLLQAVTADPNALRRFRQEAKAASALSHPNIDSIIDFGVDEKLNAAYLVMDYLDGGSLESVIEDCDVIPVERFCRIFLQACRALGHAHKHGIIHRDIKPSNLVLLNRGEEEDVLVIVDFGLVKIQSSDSQEQKLTTTNTLIGSPLFMSPEQCRGLSTIDHRTDVYSLGCVMYKALTGYLPIIGDSALDTLFKHVSQQPRSFNEANPQVRVPWQLEKVVMRALAKDPEFRQQSMSQLGQEIAEALNLSVSGNTSLSTNPQLSALSYRGDPTSGTVGGGASADSAADADGGLYGANNRGDVTGINHWKRPSVVRPALNRQENTVVSKEMNGVSFGARDALRDYQAPPAKARNYAVVAAALFIGIAGLCALVLLALIGQRQLTGRTATPTQAAATTVSSEPTRTSNPVTISAIPAKAEPADHKVAVASKPVQPKKKTEPAKVDPEKILSPARILVDHGDLAFDNGHWDDALNKFKQASDLIQHVSAPASMSVPLVAKLTVCADKLRDNKSAVLYLNRLGELYFEHPESLPVDSDLLMDLSRACLRHNANGRLAIELQERTLSCLQSSNDRRVDEVAFSLANTYRKENEVAKAIHYYRLAVAKSPFTPPAEQKRKYTKTLLQYLVAQNKVSDAQSLKQELMALEYPMTGQNRPPFFGNGGPQQQPRSKYGGSGVGYMAGQSQFGGPGMNQFGPGSRYGGEGVSDYGAQSGPLGGQVLPRANARLNKMERRLQHQQQQQRRLMQNANAANN